MAGTEPTRADFLDAAHEMAAAGHPTLARLLAEEAADRTENPADKADILREFNGRDRNQRGDY
ncbi:hypothetical protein [Streptomyces xanthophaeus]|uniref:hypothetical protein n=1 Tax=Streptomyces xanthophaeus TaxID=67385 RepID=UPI0004CD6023|nr:hypothetical protein [Streptomyces xanthophaeus]